MARINDTSRYAYDAPSTNDYVIGTDGDSTNKKTRNYRISDILQLFLDGSEIDGIDQNNKFIEKSLGLVATETTVAEAVMALPEFQIGERELYVFTLTKKIYDEGAGSGSPTQNPIMKLYLFKYIFKKGKGYYGVETSNPTTELDMGDFIEMRRDEIEIASTTSENPVLYTVSNTNGQSAVNAINTSGTYAILDGKDAYFQVFNVGGLGGSIIYRFVGEEGSYGVGATQVVSGNLITIEELGIATASTTNISIKESIPLFVPAGSTKAAVINALPTFTVSQNELYIFNVVETITSTTSANVFLQTASYFLKRGKGVYGTGNPTAPLTESDFKLNFKESSSNTNSPKPVDYYNFDKSGEDDIVAAINASPTPVVKNNDNTTVVEFEGIKYNFVGANGSYGNGLLQADSEDIEELENDNYTIDELTEVVTDSIVGSKNTFTEAQTFDKLIQLTSVSVLPTPADSGMIVNRNNVLHFYNGTSWYTLDMTIMGV
jgi:hypothetical protein